MPSSGTSSCFCGQKAPLAPLTGRFGSKKVVKSKPASSSSPLLALYRELLEHLVQDVGDRPRDGVEEQLEERDQRHQAAGDHELVGPREDGGGQNLAADEHHADAEQQRAPAGHELVEEHGQRLVGQGVEEQQRDQEQVVILRKVESER